MSISRYSYPALLLTAKAELSSVVVFPLRALMCYTSTTNSVLICQLSPNAVVYLAYILLKSTLSLLSKAKLVWELGPMHKTAVEKYTILATDWRYCYILVLPKKVASGLASFHDHQYLNQCLSPKKN